MHRMRTIRISEQENLILSAVCVCALCTVCCVFRNERTSMVTMWYAFIEIWKLLLWPFGQCSRFQFVIYWKLNPENSLRVAYEQNMGSHKFGLGQPEKREKTKTGDCMLKTHLHKKTTQRERIIIFKFEYDMEWYRNQPIQTRWLRRSDANLKYTKNSRSLASGAQHFFE